jgi:hypothetical protein
MIHMGHSGDDNIQMSKCLLSYYPKGMRIHRLVNPASHLCDLCQREKPVQNNRVVLHSASTVSGPMERCLQILCARLLARSEATLRSWWCWILFSKFVLFPCAKIFDLFS